MNDLRKQLAAAKDAIPEAPNFVGKVMERLPSSVPAALDQRRSWAIRSPLMLAACLLVAFGLWVVFDGRNGGGGNLYAQVVAAIDEARSLHGVASRWQDGKVIGKAEIHYERGAGVYFREESGGREQICIDDGQNQWRYTTGDPAVRKSPSTDAMGPARQVLTAAAEAINEAERKPEGDCTINGMYCQHYMRVYPGGGWRSHHWIDGQKRIRRYEQEELHDGKWQRVKFAEVQYDLPIDRSIFKPKLPPDVKVVDIAQALDQVVSLDKAIYKREEMGAVVAVHRVQRLSNGWIYVVSSVRPTEQVRRLIGSQGPDTRFAWLELGPSPKRLDPQRYRQYVPYKLATINHDGILGIWTLLKPVGDWSDVAGQYDLSFRINIFNGRWGLRLRSEGKKNWGEFRSVALLPITDSEASITDIGADVYGQLKTLEPVVASVQLELQPKPFTDAEMEPLWQKGKPRDERRYHGRSEPPSKITLEDYQRELTEVAQPALPRQGRE